MVSALLIRYKKQYIHFLAHKNHEFNSNGRDFLIGPNPVSWDDGILHFYNNSDKALRSVIIRIFDPINNELMSKKVDKVTKGVFYSWQFRKEIKAADMYCATLEVLYKNGDKESVKIIFGIKR